MHLLKPSRYNTAFISEKTLINKTTHQNNFSPLFFHSSCILQLPPTPGKLPESHFFSNFDRFSSAFDKHTNGAHLQLCAWHCIACRLVHAVCTRLLLQQGPPHRLLLRIALRVQCAWGLGVDFGVHLVDVSRGNLTKACNAHLKEQILKTLPFSQVGTDLLRNPSSENPWQRGFKLSPPSLFSVDVHSHGLGVGGGFTLQRTKHTSEMQPWF